MGWRLPHCSLTVRGGGRDSGYTTSPGALHSVRNWGYLHDYEKEVGVRAHDSMCLTVVAQHVQNCLAWP